MESANNHKGLDRYLSRLDVWAMAFGCMVGWGAFVMPGTTFLPVAGPLGTVIAIAVSTAIMLIVGSNFSFLMTHSPGTGGVYSYTKNAFGRDNAFLSSWFLCLAYLTIVFLNATALFIVIRTMFGSLLQKGLHYVIAGNDIYLGEVALSVIVLAVIGVLFISAEDGKDALDKVAASDPGYYDAVLMDIQMPVMDGYEATRAIRSLENEELAQIPVIAMTANAFKEDEEAAFEAGMQAHIAKPLDIDKMMETLKRVLKGHPHRQEDT